MAGQQIYEYADVAAPILRNSERKDFLRCMWRWWMAWREGLVPIGRPADPLWFGIGVHEALAAWYSGPGTKRGPHPADFWMSWCKDEELKVRASTTENWRDDKWVEARDLGESMLVGYVDEYGADESWHVIAPEETFRISIPYRRKDGVLVMLCGTFDLVYRDLSTDLILLGEHKTAKQINTNHLPMDNQAGTYWAVASKVLQARGVLRKGDQIAGIMYNFLRKGIPDPRETDEQGRALNKDGSISKNQPRPLYHRELVERTRGERATQLRRIQTEAMWMGAAKRAGNRSLDELTKSSTRDCSWDCQFYEMCQLHEKGGDDWEEFRDALFKVRDPYADHRKSS